MTDISYKQETLRGSNAIDLLKFLMATMIVAMHTSLCKELTNPWFRIAVPIFFILSSYFFFLKLNEKTNVEKGKVLRYYVKRVFLLYTFWLIILAPFVLITKWDILSSYSLLKILVFIVRGFLTGTFFGASWFLIALMIGVPTIFFIAKWISNKWLFVITLFINLAIVFQCGYGNGCKPIELFRILMLHITGTSLEYTFLVSLFWIVVGKWFAESNIKINSIHLYMWCAISMVCLFLENKLMDRNGLAFRHDLYISLIPLCMVITLIVGNIKITIKNAKILRNLSTIIYCVHYTLKDFILYLHNNSMDTTKVFLVTYLLSVVIGIVIIKFTLTHKNSILQYAF